jgi:hypothetical protein
MRRSVVVAVALGLSTPAYAGGFYMGLSLGASGAGHDRTFDSLFDSRGHAAMGVTMGVELHGFTIDLDFLGAGYTLRANRATDAALMWMGADVGRRVWLDDRLALGASLGLHAALLVPWAEDDVLPPELAGAGGESWTASARIEYFLARQPPLNPDYRGRLKSLDLSLVLEARRERMFLELGDVEAEPAVTLVTVGLRGGLGW